MAYIGVSVFLELFPRFWHFQIFLSWRLSPVLASILLFLWVPSIFEINIMELLDEVRKRFFKQELTIQEEFLNLFIYKDPYRISMRVIISHVFTRKTYLKKKIFTQLQIELIYKNINPLVKQQTYNAITKPKQNIDSSPNPFRSTLVSNPSKRLLTMSQYRYSGKTKTINHSTADSARSDWRGTEEETNVKPVVTTVVCHG